MQFIPLWTSVLRSRKVASLSESLRWTWIACLLVAQEHDHRHGTLPNVDDMSYALHMEPEELMSRLSRLSRSGFVEERDGVYSIHDWDDWKHRPDPTATARKRAERDRKKQKASTVQGDKVESPATDSSSDVTVTAVTSESHGCHAPTQLNSTQLNREPPYPPDGESESPIEPFDPGPPDTPSPSMDPEELRVCRMAEEIGGDVGWATWASQRFRLGDKPHILEAALSEAVNCGKVNQKYVATVASRYAKEGVPKPNGYRGGNSKPRSEPLPDYAPPVTDLTQIYHPDRLPKPKAKPQ